MGLDIRPGDARWSYGGFAEFRRNLATEDGIELDRMVGFGGDQPWETSNGQHITTLAPLLNHSDCDGYLHASECEEVLPRLRLIIERWSLERDPVKQYDVQQGRELITAMEHSVEHGCAVVFQ